MERGIKQMNAGNEVNWWNGMIVLNGIVSDNPSSSEGNSKSHTRAIYGYY